MSFKPIPAPTPSAPTADTSVAKWRMLTEALIFAAPYGTSEYLRHLDATGRPYNRESAIIRCRALSDAINEEFSHLGVRLLRCHAANDSKTFRLRYGHLLPKRPHTPSQAERRTGISDDQRARDMENVF